MSPEDSVAALPMASPFSGDSAAITQTDGAPSDHVSIAGATIDGTLTIHPPIEISNQLAPEGILQPQSTSPLGQTSSSPKDVANQKRASVKRSESDQPSWAKVALSSSNTLKKRDLIIKDADGAPSIEIPEDVLNDENQLWKKFLIGRFLEEAPHVGKVHMIVNKIWLSGDKRSRIDVQTVDSSTMKFRVSDPQLRARLLRRSLWRIAGVPMVLTAWNPIEPVQPVLKSIPIWVDFKNVPRRLYSDKGLECVASFVGEPKHLHPDTLACKNLDVARVFVEVDLTKELPSQFTLTSKEGLTAEVSASYPWLPPRCLVCMKWGHNDSTCGGSTNSVAAPKRILKRGEEVNLQKNSDPLNFPAAVAETEELENSEGDKERMENPPVKEHSKENSQEIQPPETGKEAKNSSTGELDSEPLSRIQPTHDNQILPLTKEKSPEKSKETVNEETEWKQVSPTKTQRHDKPPSSENSFPVSPSRYAVLEDGEIDSEDLEVPEPAKLPTVNEEHREQSDVDTTSNEEQLQSSETPVRQSLPRAHKGINRFRGQTSVLTSRIPSQKNKKGNKKKSPQ